MFQRLLHLPTTPTRSFFLWGARQIGKTALLKVSYPMALRIDLLKSDSFARYAQRPALLREEMLALRVKPQLAIIDEVQKVPMLLDEVHWLIEELGIVFALCGSSARKLKRGQANLLGGRALRFELHGLVSAEIGTGLDPLRILNHGYLPSYYLDEDPLPALRSYVNDYLKEEIAQEGLVRNLPAFGRFLEVAAITDTEIVHYTHTASDCGVKAPTVREYYQILEDTLLGTFLPAYVTQAKRKIIHSPKFYMSDVGVVNVLAKRGKIEWGSPACGHAFENWIFHEIRSFLDYTNSDHELSYWRLAIDHEVDFIVGKMQVAIEAKSSNTIGNKHLKGLRELKKEHPSVQRCIVVCNEPTRRITDDKIEIVPIREFLRELWDGGMTVG
jgi:uncharacterized protein